jgi:dipeptidyl aminopeptidase/acylaminoacyl peptidase
MVAALVTLALLAGCDSFLAEQMVKAPNAGRSVTAISADDRLFASVYGIDRIERVEVGPPAAAIACWIIEPDGDAPPRGTIFVLHGFGDGPTWMAGKARVFAREGYRAILVSLRGYAGSSGEHRTFTVVERRDLTQVLDGLSERGLISGPVGVWGMSYGAATAIAWAGEDPRVKAVVAVAGFSSMRSVVPQFTSTLLPLVALTMDDDRYRQIVDAAGVEGGFDPDDADLTRSIAKTSASVLLLHGTWDAIVPFEHGERLAAAGGPNTRFVPLPHQGHISVWFDVDGAVEREAVAWMHRWLEGGTDGG